MGIPGIQELYNPILGYLLECRQDTLVSIRKAMQEYFYISEDDVFVNEKHEASIPCPILKWFAKSVVINKKNTMLEKADKTLQNSAL